MFVCEECQKGHLSKAAKQGIERFIRSFGKCEVCNSPQQDCRDVRSGANWAWASTAEEKE